MSYQDYTVYEVLGKYTLYCQDRLLYRGTLADVVAYIHLHEMGIEIIEVREPTKESGDD